MYEKGGDFTFYNAFYFYFVYDVNLFYKEVGDAPAFVLAASCHITLYMTYKLSV
jgi:hypothetical protein